MKASNGRLCTFMWFVRGRGLMARCQIQAMNNVCLSSQLSSADWLIISQAQIPFLRVKETQKYSYIYSYTYITFLN